MIDVNKVNETKEKILNTIKNAGPSFPTRISRESGISPLFIGALLSEMVAEKKLVMSSMKVGSSPLYFMSGQESQLENFTQFLNSKEKEAVIKLKENKILDDEAEDPAIRVALRKIKDFAIPINVREGSNEKLFWKFFSILDKEAQELIENKINPKIDKTIEDKKEISREAPIIEIKEERKEKKKEKKVENKKVDKNPSKFTINVKDYLLSKEIEVIEDMPSKNKEYNAKVRIDTPLGKQEYLLLAKEKKKITEDDLAIALHKAQLEKMPSLLLTTGDLDKTAKPYLDQWKNLLKFEKFKG